jgi:hypothetical protein
MGIVVWRDIGSIGTPIWNLPHLTSKVRSLSERIGVLDCQRGSPEGNVLELNERN